MTTRQRIALGSLFFYVAIAAGLSVFHANNFLSYSDSEGAAEINYMEFLLFSSMIFQAAMYWLLKSINWKWAILSTIVNLLLSIALTILIVDLGDYSESAEQLIIIYGCCYVGIFAIVEWVQVRLSFV